MNIIVVVILWENVFSYTTKWIFLSELYGFLRKLVVQVRLKRRTKSAFNSLSSPIHSHPRCRVVQKKQNASLQVIKELVNWTKKWKNKWKDDWKELAFHHVSFIGALAIHYRQYLYNLNKYFKFKQNNIWIWNKQ